MSHRIGIYRYGLIPDDIIKWPGNYIVSRSGSAKQAIFNDLLINTRNEKEENNYSFCIEINLSLDDYKKLALPEGAIGNFVYKEIIAGDISIKFWPPYAVRLTKKGQQMKDDGSPEFEVINAIKRLTEKETDKNTTI